MPHITVNQANIYYEIHGKGHPVILIGGYTCDHFFWDPILNALKMHFQVVIFDNRGIGQTTDHEKILSASLLAEDIISLSKALNLHRPHLIGQSMGGTIVQEIAYRYSDLIDKIVIMSSTSKWREAMLMGTYHLLTLEKLDLPFDLIFEGVAFWIFGSAFLNDKKALSFFKKKLLENPYPQSIFDQERQFNILKNFDGTKHLPLIKSPTLVLYGKEDLLSLPYESKLIASKIPHAKLIELPCAHQMVAEVPDLVIKNLIDFLQG